MFLWIDVGLKDKYLELQCVLLFTMYLLFPFPPVSSSMITLNGFQLYKSGRKDVLRADGRGTGVTGSAPER